MPRIRTPNPPMEASWKHPAHKPRHSRGLDHDAERLMARTAEIAPALYEIGRRFGVPNGNASGLPCVAA